MQARTLDGYQLLHRGALALGRAERFGMRVDVEYCEKQKVILTRRIERSERLFAESKLARHWQHVYGGTYNMRSDDQLGHMLYVKMGLAPFKETEGGKGGTDEESLLAVDIPELQHIITHRKLSKIRDTYLDSFVREQRDGWVHPFFNLHTVKSYRSSSDRPNFQNVPEHDEDAKRICQRAVYTRKGHLFMKADFSSLEVNIAACYHKDPTMISYLLDPKSDMHADSAKELFLLNALDKSAPAGKRLRFEAKNNFVFAEFYGSYYVECARNLAHATALPTSGRFEAGQGIATPDNTPLADHFIKRGVQSYDDFETVVRKAEDRLWKERFPVYAKWREKWYAEYERKGYFDLLTGFRCTGYMRRNEVINLPIQGAAFHCLLWTLIRLDEIAQQERWDSRIVGEVHDDVYIDTHPDEKEHIAEVANRIVSEELPRMWPWIIVPLKIEIKYGPVDGSLYDVQ